jgi:hypothetical protein
LEVQGGQGVVGREAVGKGDEERVVKVASLEAQVFENIIGADASPSHRRVKRRSHGVTISFKALK